jgi:hypothetical protein
MYEEASSARAALRYSVLGGSAIISSKNLTIGLLAVTSILYPARAASTAIRGEALKGSNIQEPRGTFIGNQVEIMPSGIGGRYRDNGSDFVGGTPGMYGIVPNTLVFINL